MQVRSRSARAEALSAAVVVAEQGGEAGRVGAQLGELVAVGAHEVDEGVGELVVPGSVEPLKGSQEDPREPACGLIHR